MARYSFNTHDVSHSVGGLSSFPCTLPLLPNPPSVSIVFVGHGDFASGRLVKAWPDYRAVWWMEGRPQTPFTWEQKPGSFWIEGLSICLSLKKLKNFLQRLTNPLLYCLSPSYFLLSSRPPFSPSLSPLLFFLPGFCPSLFLCSQLTPLLTSSLLSLLSPTIQSVILDIRVSLACMMFGFFQAFSGLSGSLARPPLKFWFDCRHNTRRHQCVSSLYSLALAYNETDPIHENDSCTIAPAHSIFSLHIK